MQLILNKFLIILFLLFFSCSKVITKKVHIGSFPATEKESRIENASGFHVIVFEREGWKCDSFVVKDRIDSLNYNVEFYLKKQIRQHE